MFVAGSPSQPLLTLGQSIADNSLGYEGVGYESCVAWWRGLVATIGARFHGKRKDAGSTPRLPLTFLFQKKKG